MKVKKTLVFGEGTDIAKLLNSLAIWGKHSFKNLVAYPDNEIVDAKTGEVVCKAPTIEGEAEPIVWKFVQHDLNLIELGNPEYKDYLFAFEKEEP